MLSIFGVSVTLSFILAFFRGSLLSTWLSINTVQLVVHVPMIASSLPANAHYFMLNLLSIVRMSLDSFNSTVNELTDKLEEYELLTDESSFLTSSLHNLGYRHSFARNMFSIGCAALALTLVWLLVSACERILTLCCRSKARKLRGKARMTNVVVRFLLEVHFELMICALITLSNLSEAGSIWWLISLAAIVASGAAMATLSCTACKKSKDGSQFSNFTSPENENHWSKDGETNTQQTRSIYNTNEPLNLKACAAVQLELEKSPDGEKLECGEPE
mmetsp:Transcript_18024/g.22571  ORF Transcript_18024/g.22571 Transcript_18024/m.22571 type:complete len:275 (-) Transcript_18024:1061-1885(-)